MGGLPEGGGACLRSGSIVDAAVKILRGFGIEISVASHGVDVGIGLRSNHCREAATLNARIAKAGRRARRIKVLSQSRGRLQLLIVMYPEALERRGWRAME